MLQCAGPAREPQSRDGWFFETLVWAYAAPSEGGAGTVKRNIDSGETERAPQQARGHRRRARPTLICRGF